MPSGHILFDEGVLAHVVGADRRAYMVFEIDILGTAGRLKILNNGHRTELWEAAASTQDSEDRALQFKGVVHEGDEGDRILDELSDIVRCVESGGEPACSGRDGRAAVEVTAAFLKSLDTGREVALPLKGKDLRRAIPFREVL